LARCNEWQRAKRREAAAAKQAIHSPTLPPH
jgi:hypothetical protein